MLAASSQPAPTARAIWGKSSAMWRNDNCGAGGCYSHVMMPDGMSCFFSDAGISAYMGMITASSNHAGGVNCCFLDGSVKFIKDSISQPAWWAMSTRAGGEILDVGSY